MRPVLDQSRCVRGEELWDGKELKCVFSSLLSQASRGMAIGKTMWRIKTRLRRQDNIVDQSVARRKTIVCHIYHSDRISRLLCIIAT